MSRLVFAASDLAKLRAELLDGELETCAIILGRSVSTGGNLARIIAKETIMPPNGAYVARTPTRAILRAEFVAEAIQRARRENASLTFVHTHPFPLNRFSKEDDFGEIALAAATKNRIPNAAHAALLLTPERSIARELGTNNNLRVFGVGERLAFEETDANETLETRYDRQVRMFGAQGQRLLQTLKVGIVGLGGTGTFILQALIHLGIHNFVLLDPDTVEETNLNRLVGATRDDIGLLKVQVAEKWAKKIRPELNISARPESILRGEVAESLADVDFLFGCTDSHGSRAVLNQIAYQYLVPVIDMGVVVATDHGKITNIAARTQLLAPGLACMTCGNLLDPEEVRRDLLTEYERKQDPYILGEHEPAPAVISLNGVISSMAITMFLNTAIGIPGTARLLNYNAISGSCRPASCVPHPVCVVCSAHGAFARGNEWKLPARYG